MGKICYQNIVGIGPTPCYIRAGNHPCETPGCPVGDRVLKIYESGRKPSDYLILLLLHSICRLSSLSGDNQEFFKRI